ncbi:DUF6879 family protein [Streptomyces sp. NPDC049881]|uniref:DUF6879 family protein n=1 Tax=Streptomyces sp. NPDC049881 TaxID=3155778 RepID=UPI00343C1DE8
MDRPAYRAHFKAHKERVRDRPCWKLERRQHFEEEGDPSRDALRRGDWADAIRLLEDDRAGLLRTAEDDRRRGSTFHRLRVVEEPPTPYLRWELHALRMQAECGRPVRVVAADALRAAERDGPLPEVVVLGDRALYEVLYTDEGRPTGAVAFTDPELVAHWTDFIASAYASAEDVRSYSDRAVAGLAPPPQPEG